jgi:hypothetical protein
MRMHARRSVWRLYCSFTLHLRISRSRYSVGGSWERAMANPRMLPYWRGLARAA